MNIYIFISVRYIFCTKIRQYFTSSVLFLFSKNFKNYRLIHLLIGKIIGKFTSSQPLVVILLYAFLLELNTGLVVIGFYTFDVNKQHSSHFN